jgi:putative protein-disulfide isomerase
MQQSEKILFYFADPMCSWCWGFAPVFDAVKQTYGDRLKFSLIMGGLRPGTTEAVTDEFRDEILHHWRDVHQRTRQDFKFDGAMPAGFIYDTEPPSRALVTVGELKPEVALDFFKTLQSAFYAEQKDVTQKGTLSDIASQYDVRQSEFIKRFESDEMKEKTRAHFYKARQLGVRGFPTLVLQTGSDYQLITRGYQSFEEISSGIDFCLARKS